MWKITIKMNTKGNTQNLREARQQGRWSYRGNVRGFQDCGLQKLTEIANIIYDAGEITRQMQQANLHDNAKIMRKYVVQPTQIYSHHETKNNSHSKSNFEPRKGKIREDVFVEQFGFLKGKITIKFLLLG